MPLLLGWHYASALGPRECKKCGKRKTFVVDRTNIIAREKSHQLVRKMSCAPVVIR